MFRALFGFICLALVAHAEMTFETLKVGTNTFKNARIIQTSPVDLLVGHDDGYKRIKLQDLPDTLKTKYLYDAQRAADYEKAEAQKRQLIQAQNAGVARNTLLAKEGQLRAQIADRQKDLKRISKDIGTQDRRTKGKSAHSADRKYADNLRGQKIQIRDEIWRLQDELQRVQAQRHRFE